jgi:hypothetical protein
VARLRRLEAPLDERAPDPDVRMRAVEAEIRPAQGEQFGGAQAGGGEEPEHEPVARMHESEQVAKLLAAQRPHLALAVGVGPRPVREARPDRGL